MPATEQAAQPDPDPTAGADAGPTAGADPDPAGGADASPVSEAGAGARSSWRPATAPPSSPALDRRLDLIGRQPFRAEFRLRGRDLVTARLHGPATLRRHARDLIGKRLAPAEPYKDGKQTPYRGHPVFVAQHATATCCRGCLQRWHRVPGGHELTRTERAYVVDVICRWIEREVAAG